MREECATHPFVEEPQKTEQQDDDQVVNDERLGLGALGIVARLHLLCATDGGNSEEEPDGLFGMD